MAYQQKNPKRKVDTGFGEPIWSLEEAKKLKESKDKFEEKNEYDKQADDFLKETNTKFSIKYLKHDKYFPDDKESRDIYRFKLTKDGKTYSGTFGQSITDSRSGKVPRPYDVLASLSADIGHGEYQSFEEFCDTFGYDQDSMKAHKIYNAVEKERQGITKLYSEKELDKLGEIN